MHEPVKQLFPEQAALAAQSLCTFCRKPVDPDAFTDALSRKEFGISGMCQQCQDGFFQEDDE